MKIKRERQVRFDELITYIIKNEVISSVFVSNRGNKTVVDTKGDFSHFGVFNQTDIFTITEEVEIDEDTQLSFIVIEKNGYTRRFHNSSIRKILKVNDWIYFIYLQNEDFTIGELIWMKERGLVD